MCLVESTLHIFLSSWLAADIRSSWDSPVPGCNGMDDCSVGSVLQCDGLLHSPCNHNSKFSVLDRVEDIQRTKRMTLKAPSPLFGGDFALLAGNSVSGHL